MLLIVFWFWEGFRVAHRFLFWEEDPCCSLLFALGGGSVLLIDFLFWEGILAAHRFFILGVGSVLLMFCFVLGGKSVLLIVFCFERGIRVAHRFLF